MLLFIADDGRIWTESVWLGVGTVESSVKKCAVPHNAENFLAD